MIFLAGDRFEDGLCIKIIFSLLLRLLFSAAQRLCETPLIAKPSDNFCLKKLEAEKW
jgi:hypothetical protein